MKSEKDIITELEDYIFEKTEELHEEVREIKRSFKGNSDKCLEDYVYINNYGEIHAYVKIYSLLQKMKKDND
ncbi:hypothetical protein ACFFHH_20300 [Cytobacillus solani]|uniref:Uncharacterized protein n=1 Tax=Cytobacillus solani TaxID=1637975 RepID=A0A0Q3TCS8_9BACI|nr:hypothetical protein [Cytobacillus solani]KOP84127.1 hypothetical protein AMS60_00335 [Bacillus sp. FJAT-21945]KQL20981.1 hypothetical protein AN957_21950 [Cytobacillus solani]